MNETLHEELIQRVGDACSEGARSVDVRTHHVACNGGRDEEGESNE